VKDGGMPSKRLVMRFRAGCSHGVSARLRYMAGQKWGTQRYMNMKEEVSA